MLEKPPSSSFLMDLPLAPPLSSAFPAPRATSSASSKTPLLSVQLSTPSSRIHCTNSKPTSLILNWPCAAIICGIFAALAKDAAGLTQLSSTVEDVFASDDLPRAAETLANMGHCLSAVGEISYLEICKRVLRFRVQTKHLEALIELHSMDRWSVASQRVAAFADTVNELVYDVLISKVRNLGDVSRLSIWSSVEEQGASPLLTFSAYPQSYVTSVHVEIDPISDAVGLTQLSSTVEDVFASGDLPGAETPANMGHCLSAVGEDQYQPLNFSISPTPFPQLETKRTLTLPQQLEPLAEGISNSESNDVAQQLRGIQYISDRGAQQLSVDIEYLSNVLSALSMPIPPVLATFQSCLSTPRNQLKDLLKTDSGNQLDLPTANLVCKMRRVNLDS
ncbi:hypothetical protein RJT34_31556 [Clitoria ternatea]|uniref:Conserved oligomeric Golgi complex subunit 7 n=1 Tax=Clitoria ternatea TaxID=43366 RepID=A0AAN9EWM9_CLITE